MGDRQRVFQNLILRPGGAQEFFLSPLPAAISEGQMIRLESSESEIQLEIVEPGNSGIDVLMFENLGQVFIVLS